MSEWQNNMVMARLEAGDVVIICSPLGDIKAWQKDNVCYVEFIRDTRHSPNLMIYDEVPEFTSPPAP